MPRMTKNSFIEMKRAFNQISMVTIYDYSLAHAAEAAGVDCILIGDSVGMVSLGMNSTNQVSLNEMEIFCSAVAKGAPNTFLIGDLPFGSYEISDHQAVQSAVTLIKSGVQAVKLEGGARVSSKIAAINSANIPVMGHLGITPQTSNSDFGYRAYGKTEKQISQLHSDMRELESSGVFSILIEGVVGDLSEIIKKWVNIPVISIGSGRGYDGQLLLSYDLLGLYPNFRPKFAKNFAAELISEFKMENNNELGFYNLAILAFKTFIKQVKDEQFPDKEHTYQLNQRREELLKFALSLQTVS